MMRGFSLAGFLIGLVVAVLFYAVASAIVEFEHSDLVFGLIALLIWGSLTFGYHGREIGKPRA